MKSTLPRRLAQWLPIVRAAEALFGVDALLVLAVMDRESLGGEALKPRGPGGAGDKGHGRGLMQIDDRAHPTLAAALLCDGSPLLGHPVFNVLVGAHYLSTLVQQFDGTGVDPLLAASAAYNCGPGKVRRALRALPRPLSQEETLKALDPLTAGGDYVSDVLRRRLGFVVSP